MIRAATSRHSTTAGRTACTISCSRVGPSTGLDGPCDIAVRDGVIARIAKDIPSAEATQTIEVGGKVVTPGLIDLHAHVFEGVNRNGVHPDLGGVRAGVT